MGRKSTEIEYELERQRNALGARIERLKRRIQDHVDETKSELRSDVDRTVGRESKVAEHPRALLAAATGIGVVLGMASESVPVRRPKPGRNGHGPEEARQGDEERRGLRAAAGTAVVGSLQGQISGLLAEEWAAFKSGLKKSKVNDNSRLPPGVHSSARRTGSGAESDIPGGSAAAHGGRYLPREEISPDAVDADMAIEEGEMTPEEVLHRARVEDYAPREDLPAYLGGEAPFEEEPRSERRTGQ